LQKSHTTLFVFERKKRMTPLFKRLNIKEQSEIVVINAPDSFETELAGLSDVAILRSLAEAGRVTFSLCFVTTEEEINQIVDQLVAKIEGDATTWFAYPKGSSKKYKSEINRDNGWGMLGQHGFEPVRQVAIDQDWTALRFRRVEFIKSMKRSHKMAISQQGKAKTQE
jgi:hypothetical protein